MKNKLYSTVVVITLLFAAFVIYGVTTACPDVAIYVYCPEGSR